MAATTPPPPLTPSSSRSLSPSPTAINSPTGSHRSTSPSTPRPSINSSSGYNTPSRQPTPSISIHEASDEETETKPFGNGSAGYGSSTLLSPSSSSSSSRYGNRLTVPRRGLRPFVRSLGAPSPEIIPMPGSSLVGGPDDGGDTPRSIPDGNGNESDGAVDGVQGMIRLKKSQIRKLQEEVKHLEKICEMAGKGPANGA
ncbi:hypothetical protein TWF718_005255 [Orbilia javanica]|uniref:Uncharacterized protein n=1 Tax=Orbilia javanica TaxID=47235 RepID=A0AAN8MTY2_9PEZI